MFNLALPAKEAEVINKSSYNPVNLLRNNRQCAYADDNLNDFLTYFRLIVEKWKMWKWYII